MTSVNARKSILLPPARTAFCLLLYQNIQTAKSKFPLIYLSKPLPKMSIRFGNQQVKTYIFTRVIANIVLLNIR
jgi:hypothetical protein